MSSQPPVVGGASTTMHRFQIISHEAEIPLDHGKRTMTKKALEREDITTVPQVLNGERVAESMWVNSLYPRSLPKTLHPLQQLVGRQGTPTLSQEQELVWIVLFSFS